MEEGLGNHVICGTANDTDIWMQQLLIHTYREAR